jgi:hypothetical protein
MRQEIRADLRSLLAPDRAIGDSVIPPVAFFATNAIAGLGWAAVVGLAVGAGVAAWRVVRRHRVAAAIYGFLAVVVSVLAALRTDRAAGYVLPTIVMTIALAVVTAVTVFVRRPMAAWVSRFVRGWPGSWYWRDDVRPAYAQVSWYWFVFYLARTAAVWSAFEWGSLGLLLVVRVLVSWPTMLPLVIVSYVRGNRMLHALGGPTVREHIALARPPYGRQRGF